MSLWLPGAARRSGRLLSPERPAPTGPPARAGGASASTMEFLKKLFGKKGESESATKPAEKPKK